MRNVMLLAGLLSLTLGQSDLQPSSSTDVLRAIAGLFDENRAKFEHGTIQFDLADGFANGIEEAAEGNLSDQYVASCLYSFSENRKLYIQLFNQDDMAKTNERISENRGSSRLSSLRMLTNGTTTLLDRIGVSLDGRDVIHGHVIVPGGADFFRSANSVLSLGYPEEFRDDLAQNIRMVLNGMAGTGIEAVTEDEPIFGRPTIRLDLKLANGRRTFWVDLERGAIPLRIRDEVIGGDPIEQEHGDIRYVQGHGWMPFVRTIFLGGGRVKRLIIRSADFDSVPAPESFRLEFPEAVSMANISEGRGYKPQKIWDLDNLPKPSSPNSVPLRTDDRSDVDPELPGEREPALIHAGAVMVALSTIIVLLCAIIIIRRHRSA